MSRCQKVSKGEYGNRLMKIIPKKDIISTNNMRMSKLLLKHIIILLQMILRYSSTFDYLESEKSCLFVTIFQTEELLLYRN